MRAALALSLFAVAASAQDVRFADETARLPAAHSYTGGWEHFVGGGLAVFDCNNDRLPDLFAAGGEGPAQMFVNESQPGGALTFALAETQGPAGATGAYPLDVDNDGLIDLMVLRVGANRLLRGTGGCTFEDASETFGIPFDTQWSTAFSATWGAGQWLPTLAIGNYVDRENAEGPFEACDDNVLLRPQDADALRYGPAVPLAPGYCALSMLFTDWMRNGQADLRVSNDRHYYVRDGSEQMWRMEAPPRLLTAEEGWAELSIWGMGIASRDLTGDGLPEVMLTSMGDQILQIAQGAGVFENAPFEIGTYAQRPYTGGDGRPSTGWHAEFGDVNNDGRADLFIAKGNVDQMPSNAMKDPNNLLIQMPNGRFEEVGARAGIASVARGRGAALVDLNADGLLDLVVVNRRAPMEVYRNITETKRGWVSIEPRQPDRNGFAIGAWVEVRTAAGVQSVERTVGGGHAGGQLGPLHFGLGRASEAEARVIWPDGTASGWIGLRAGTRVEMLRNDAEGGLLVIPR